MTEKPVVKCDGNHGGPRCADPECWNDSPTQPAVDRSSNMQGSLVDKSGNLQGCTPAAQEPAAWYDGEPPFPQNQEWFIAETVHGDRVVLRPLPEEYSYDYTTADGTYMKAGNIKRWMQFPDSEFVAPQQPTSAQPAASAEPIAYLDLGAGGYMDVGTDLTEDQLAQLPKGRHMLAIVGTYGLDGYVAAPAQVKPDIVDLARDGMEVHAGIPNSPEYRVCAEIVRLADAAPVAAQPADLDDAMSQEFVSDLDDKQRRVYFAGFGQGWIKRGRAAQPSIPESVKRVLNQVWTWLVMTEGKPPRWEDVDKARRDAGIIADPSNGGQQ